MLAALQAKPLTTAAPLRAPEARGHQQSAGISVAPVASQGALAARVELPFSSDEQLAALLEAIHEARTTLKLDLAALCLDPGEHLLRALVRSSDQGIRVQVLAPAKLSENEAKALESARQKGLLVRRRAGLDHGKAQVVADDRVAMLFQGAVRLAGEAAWELGRSFNQAWALAGGSPASLPERPAIFASTRSASVRVGGDSQRTAKGVLIASLGAARSQIDIHVAALTDTDVLAALKAARDRGVAVRVLLIPNADQASWASLAAARDAGLMVRLGNRALPTQGALIDGTAVALSSAAWTSAALGSATVLDMREEIALAAWTDAFADAWETATPPAANSAVERVLAKLISAAQPALLALSRLAQHNWRVPGIHIGVVQVAGRWRVLAETR